MTLTADQLAQLRRMIHEPTTTTYTDQALTNYVEAYPLRDSSGYDPDHPLWSATYDMNRAAADIWEEKAAAIQDRFDFSADGGNFSRSQQYTNALAMAGLFRSKAKVRVGKILKRPTEIDLSSAVLSEEDNDEDPFYVN